MDLAAIKMKIAELDEALEKDLPGYKLLLNVMHKEFQLQPELVYKLDDSEIALLIAGMGKFHQVEITDVKDKKPISKKDGAKLSAEDV